MAELIKHRSWVHMHDEEQKRARERMALFRARDRLSMLLGRALCCDPAPDSSFILTREVLRDLGSDESSFGIALHAFVTHPDLAATITEAEGLVKLRAWVGIAYLLAAYAWSDGVPIELRRLPAFGIMHVWHNIPHFCEVLTCHSIISI
jgi:hypothetical protein